MSHFTLLLSTPDQWAAGEPAVHMYPRSAHPERARKTRVRVS